MPDMLCEITQRLLGRAGVPLEGAEKDRKQSQNSRQEKRAERRTRKPSQKARYAVHDNQHCGGRGSMKCLAKKTQYQKIMKEVARVAL